MTARAIAFVAMLIVASPCAASASAQVRHCQELAEEIAAGIRKKSTYFTLRIVRAGDEGDRRVVGSCEGGTKRILFELTGKGEVVLEEPKPPARKAAAPPAPQPELSKPEPPKPETAKPEPPRAPAPKLEPPAAPTPTPATLPAPAPVAPPKPAAPVPTPTPTKPVALSPPSAVAEPPADVDARLAVKQVGPSVAPRQMARTQLASLMTLAVEEGADHRDTVDEFVQHLKVGGLPDLASVGAKTTDYVIVEADHLDAASVFTMVTANGKVILAERSSRLIGLLPEQHNGMFDLCLLVLDFPAPGSNYSDWTAEFNGNRYMKKTRQFKSESCLDRVALKIPR